MNAKAQITEAHTVSVVPMYSVMVTVVLEEKQFKIQSEHFFFFIWFIANATFCDESSAQ